MRQSNDEYRNGKLVPIDEVHKAYGFDTKEAFDAAHESAIEGTGAEWPELIEGYSYQSNSSGSGIVDHGHHGE